MKKNILTVLMLSSGLLLSACNDSNDDYYQGGGNEDPNANNITKPVVGIPTAYNSDGMSEASADSVLMTYKMKGINGNEVQATALVFTPKTVPPVGGWPIVAWAHGTTGVADKCAPSQQGLKGTEILLKLLLAKGYVVVAPDYEGLGEPSGREAHPFLNVKSEAYSITDAVVAARDYISKQGKVVSKDWLTIGHSQGGQAALGVAQYASRAQLNYKGTIAIAPASNLGGILTLGNASVAAAPADVQIPVYAKLDTFTALITAGLRNQNPSLKYNQIFKVPTDQIAQKADSICYDVLGNDFGVAMGQYAATTGMGTLDGYPRTVDGFMAQPLVKNFLEKDSQPLTAKVTTPIIIYQGGADSTVPEFATSILIKDAEKLGTKIQLVENPIWDHTTAYTSNIQNIVADVKEMLGTP